jgi:amino acid adenylation domain-containing protein
VPVSFGQQRIWFTSLLDPGGSLYNTVTTMTFEPPIDLAALRRAVTALVRRHAGLRTIFVETDGRPYQWVRPDLVPELEVDVADLNAFVQRPFDLATGPLLRLAVVTRTGVLVVCVHHIVTDGWSMGVFVTELQVLYKSERDGSGAVLPPLLMSYTDYAERQRATLTDARSGVLETFWRRELAGAAPLELRAVRRRPARPTFAMSAVGVHVPADVVHALRGVAREASATLFMTVLAGFAALLARQSGQDDIVVGTPVAGRDRSDLENIIGFFVNTVVLRCDTSSDPTFRDLIGRVRGTFLRAFAHADMPFERLVEILHPVREVGRNPIYQVVLHLIDAAPEHDDHIIAAGRDVAGRDAAADRPAMRPASPDRATQSSSPFDLVLFLRAGRDGLRGELQFRTDLFGASTAHRLVDDLIGLLAALAGDPDRAVHAVPLTGSVAITPDPRSPTGERGSVVVAHRGAVPEQVVRQAESTPDAAAVVTDEGTTSYRDLLNLASGVAARLVESGLQPESLVGVCLPRGPLLVAAELGVWLAGGAFLSLDPTVPQARNEAIIADARPVEVIDRNWVFDGAAPRAPFIPTDPNRLAYVIYTSGSSGRPKGVEVEHGSLANLIDWHLRTYGVGRQDRAGMMASPAFDASVWEVWPYLCAGAALHVPPADVVTPDVLLDWLADHRISITFLATPLAEAVLAEPVPDTLALRHLLTGADQLRVRPPSGSRFTLSNHYGPTEATVLATAGPVESDGAGVPSIGRPIDGVVVAVVDPAGRPVPAGVPGELWIGGAGVARGYRHHDDLTAQRFTRLDGRRYYRTGDLGLIRDDGELEFLGRLDDQLKIRGFRIEPAEIERALMDHPLVASAAVAERAGRLVGYVVLGSAIGADTLPGTPETDLKSHLRALLPAHMVPSRFVFLAELPTTTSGKIDRRALPIPADPDIGDTARSAARTPVEVHLQTLFAQLLGRSTVGRDDDFFDLGGHSLLAAQLISRIRSALGRELPISALFDAPTVAGLAALVDDSAAPARPPIGRAARARFRATVGADGSVILDDRLRRALELGDATGRGRGPDPRTGSSDRANRVSG